MTGPGRRPLLGAAAAAPLAAVPAIAGERSADAEVIALCAELERLERRFLRLANGPAAMADSDLYDAAVASIFAAQGPLMRRVCLIAGTSPAAIIAKLRAVAVMAPEKIEELADGDSPTVEHLLASACHDALRLRPPAPG